MQFYKENRMANPSIATQTQNPLIESSHGETITNVREVLRYLQCSIEGVADADTCAGAALILRVAQDALVSVGSGVNHGN